MSTPLLREVIQVLVEQTFGDRPKQDPRKTAKAVLALFSPHERAGIIDSIQSGDLDIAHKIIEDRMQDAVNTFDTHWTVPFYDAVKNLVEKALKVKGA